VCAGRVYQLFLILCKIVLFVCHLASHSSGAACAPDQVDSWSFLRSVLAESNAERKRQAMQSLASETRLTTAELKTIAQASMHLLTGQMQQQPPVQWDGTTALRFTRYLLVATLARIPTPRSQVIRMLRFGTTFQLDAADSCWRIVLTGQATKTGAPLKLVFPPDLSALYSFYQQSVRPIRVGPLADRGVGDDQYVFPSVRTLQAFQDLALWTKTTTTELIGRPIAPHQFRGAVVTMAYEQGANADELHGMADLMQHSSATQQRFYRLPRMEQQSRHLGQRLGGMLAVSTPVAQPTQQQQQQSQGDPPRGQHQQLAQVQQQQQTVSPGPAIIGRSKWSPLEESALQRGIDRHGHKWTQIQADEQFARALQEKTTQQMRDKARCLKRKVLMVDDDDFAYVSLPDPSSSSVANDV
jgi:hypothetical protein